MAPTFISSVREGRGRHLQPHRNRYRLSYPTECKREICRLSDDFKIRGKQLQEKVWQQLHYRISLSTLHGIIKNRAHWMESPSLARCRVNYKRRGYELHEKEMLAWVHGWVRRHGTLTYACLMEKGETKSGRVGTGRLQRLKRMGLQFRQTSWLEDETPLWRRR